MSNWQQCKSRVNKLANYFFLLVAFLANVHNTTFFTFKRKHASKKVSSYHIFLAKEYLCYHAICVVRIKYWIIFPTSSTKNVTVSKSLWVIYLTFVENKLLLEISKHCLEKTDLKSSVYCLEIFSEAVFLKQWLCKYRYFLFQKILSKDH